MGKKHKRSKAHSRFLLQVRLFCQKTCKTYDFVLLFQSENAKTEISITHPLRRISSASDNCTKLCHCLLLISRIDFVAAVQKIRQCLRCVLYLLDLRKMVLHLRLLLNIVIVPNVVEWIHLYDLLFARHILINQGFLVVFNFGQVLLFLDNQSINTSTLFVEIFSNFFLFTL